MDELLMEDAPVWLGKNKVVNEQLFCLWLTEDTPLKYINNQFYQSDGSRMNDETVKKMIYDELSPYLERGLARKTNDLFNVLKMVTYTEKMPVREDCVHLANGTYYLDTGEFSEEKIFSTNRLNVNFNPDAPVPVKWNDFLFELLETEDITTLQEYLGYCLIPTTRSHKMMLLVGKGGEGKSRIGVVMRSIFQENMNVTSIQKVERSEFARADLIGKLLMVDDDIEMSAMNKTNYIKSIVTCEGPIDLEKKNVQSFQAPLYVRFLCFGNGVLTSIHDQSDGFWRRQLLLTTKDKAYDRVDDVYLAEKLIEEKEGIFLWMLEGLRRLRANGYHFTVSSRAENNIRTAMRDANNIPDFLESEGYVILGGSQEASTRNLYAAYKDWCEDNAEQPVTMKTFAGYLSNYAGRYNITSTNNIRIGLGKRCRGYTGIGIVCRSTLQLAG